VILLVHKRRHFWPHASAREKSIDQRAADCAGANNSDSKTC